MTPDQAIRHQWILEGLPAKVLVHHQKLHNIPTKDLPPHIKEQRTQYLATCSKEMQLEFRTEDESIDINETQNTDETQQKGGSNRININQITERNGRNKRVASQGFD